MDIKQYYRKIHEVETALTDKYPVVVSLETSDGGKAGTLCEVPRSVAAKMIVEGRAELASPAEKEQYFTARALSKKAAEKAELARRLQVAIISEADLKAAVTPKNENDPQISVK